MHHLRHLRPYLARYWRTLLFGLLCAALGAGASALSPYLLRLAVDDLNAGQVVSSTLLFYGGLLILVAIVDGIFKFGQRMLIAGTSYQIEYDLRRDLFERYLALDQGFYGVNHTGDLMARATNDLSAVRQFLGPGLSGSATALLTFLAAAVLMFAVTPLLATVVLLLCRWRRSFL